MKKEAAHPKGNSESFEKTLFKAAENLSTNNQRLTSNYWFGGNVHRQLALWERFGYTSLDKPRASSCSLEN